MYCLNPNCTNPNNEASDRTCRSCGFLLPLKERYIARQAISQGGFGRTFLGCDRDLPQAPPCIIKQLYIQHLSPQVRPKAIALFQQEAELLQQLGSHPQIPGLLAYFEQEQHLYLVQEFIEGEMPSAAQWHQRGGLEAKIRHLLGDLLPVLQFISDRNVIHRDIKPSNIIQRRSDGKFVLIDFGVSRFLTETAMMGGATAVGTPGYMAPEQLYGKILPASDLYALGVTCLHLLTGAEPDRLYDPVAECWLWREHLPANASISSQLSKILNALVQPSLRYRSSTAAAVLREIGLAAPQAPPSTVIAPSAAYPDNLPTQLSPSRQPQRPNSALSIVPLFDYNPLKNLLRRKRWQEADEETRRMLCQLIGKRPSQYLLCNDIERLPCAELELLDLLWEQASQGRFGFKVQGEIYQTAGKEYNVFCDRVGWPNHQSPHESQFLNYSLRAPIGHLPSRSWTGGYTWWRHAEFMTAKLIACEICVES